MDQIRVPCSTPCWASRVRMPAVSLYLQGPAPCALHSQWTFPPTKWTFPWLAFFSSANSVGISPSFILAPQSLTLAWGFWRTPPRLHRAFL